MDVMYTDAYYVIWFVNLNLSYFVIL